MISQDVSIKPGVIKVVLKSDAKALDEVVVTAMGISREKKALGYAVQDVKSDQLTQAANSNLAGALQGKVSGLDVKPSSGMPGASSQITIRGARSFSGDNTPLYVIDGMPVTSTPDVSTDIQNNGSVSGADFANRAVDIRPFVNHAHMNSIYSVYLYISPRNTYTGKPHSLHLQEQKSDPVPARWK